MSETSMGIVSRVACAVVAAFGCGGAVGLAAEATQPSVVSIEGDPSAGWRLVRNGVAFAIRGAGGPGSLEALAACGGNAIRTWGVEDVEKRVDGERMIDRAHALGIAVTVGLWLGHERHGFDWHDPAALGRQRRQGDADGLPLGLGVEAEARIADRNFHRLGLAAVKDLDIEHARAAH
jgi:hypothetical protein